MPSHGAGGAVSCPGCGAHAVAPAPPGHPNATGREGPRMNRPSWMNRRLAGAGGAAPGLPLVDAEALLDWLENHGCARGEASFGPRGVTVRCICQTVLLPAGGGAVRLLRW